MRTRFLSLLPLTLAPALVALANGCSSRDASDEGGASGGRSGGTSVCAQLVTCCMSQGGGETCETVAEGLDDDLCTPLLERCIENGGSVQGQAGRRSGS